MGLVEDKPAIVREDGGRTVLLEAGIGSFFPPKLRDRFGVQESEHVLLGSLAALGVAPGDVDVIVLSHLHFDHAGGLLLPWTEGRAPGLAFPRARYVVGARAWARAKAPHARDRASFIPELPGLLEGTGRLEVVEDGASSATLDVTITDELRNEGLARELVNRIQNLRKDKGLEVTDRILVKIQQNSGLDTAIKNNLGYICSETLTSDLQLVKSVSAANASTIEVDELITTLISIEKLN